MTRESAPKLSKTLFAAGLQCLKRLYLECYSPRLADPVGQGRQGLFHTGSAVGVLARETFPGGRLVDVPSHADAANATQTFLRDASVTALFEGAFDFEGIRVRTDILQRRGRDAFDVIEVKSSTAVKPEHIPDVAIQLYVLEGSGIPISRASVLHIDNTYVYEGGEYDLERLFGLEDVTDRARSFQAETVPVRLREMWDAMSRDLPPTEDIGPQCTKPNRCPFFGFCRINEPENPIEDLPRIGAKLSVALREANIRDIRAIPETFKGLSATQHRVRDSVVTGRLFVSPTLGPALNNVEYPILFLDFETFNPALPVFPGTHPYQQVPFQWSLHALSESGNLSHSAFLHDGDGDPRLEFVESLVQALVSQGTIVVYSSFEQTVMKQLAEQFPQHEAALLAICERLFDLLSVVRQHFYHPGFHGSFSIKAVLPAVAPDLGYHDLEIQDGLAASGAYARMIEPGLEHDERESIKSALLDYCQCDTLAMVRLFTALRSIG